jgi:serine/threonine-protein phosphatase 2B catalytic subunit
MEADEGQPPSVEEQRSIQVDNAIRAIREKKPVPEIDFTIHTMEDGTQVNTQERVCKGKPRLPHYTPPPPRTAPSPLSPITLPPRQ